MLIRYPNENIKQVFGYMYLEFREEVESRYIHLKIMGIEIVFKSHKQDFLGEMYR